MSEWFAVAELVGMPGFPTTERGVRKFIDREEWTSRCNAAGAPLVRPRAGRGGSLEYHHTLFPHDAQVHVAINASAAGAETANGQGAAWAFFEQLPDKKKGIARDRADVLDKVQQLVRGGTPKNYAVSVIASHERIGTSTIYAWLDLVAGLPREE